MTERFSVVIPVYGNEMTLRELKDRLSATLRSMAVVDHELIFVDDASPDGSWAVIESMASTDPKVVGLRLESNVGQLAAYCAGIDIARGEVLLALDADLEHPPEAIPQLVRALRGGHDLVVAQRIGHAPEGIRLVGSRTVNLVARLLRLSVSDVGSSFLVCTPDVALAMRRVIERTRRQMLLPTIFEDAARNPTAVKVDMLPSPTSAYSLPRAVGLFGEFLLVELGSTVARRTLMASGGLLVVGVHPPFRRGALRWSAALAGLGILALLIPLAFRRDPSEPMYAVAARVGVGLGS